MAVIVEIIKNVCCISVVKDYKLFRKYNVFEIVKDGANTDGTATKTDGSIAESKEKHGGGERGVDQGKTEENEGKAKSQDNEEGNEGKDKVKAQGQSEEVNNGGGEDDVRGEDEDVNKSECEANVDEDEEVEKDEGDGE